MLRLLVGLVCHAWVSGDANEAGPGPLILEPEFELVSFTPEDGKVLVGREALTAVFSLAVLPLGADLGDGPPPEELVPFLLEGPGVPGKLRWVSSSIARFDPSVDWPSDVEALQVVFNPRLRSVSGKNLQNAPGPLHFSTEPLNYWVKEVHSKQLEDLTGHRWNSDLEADRFQPKGAFECPSDARIQVGFSSPVVLERFWQDSSMLQLRDRAAPGDVIPINEIAPCKSEEPKPLILELGEPAVANESSCLEFSLPQMLSTGGDYVVSLKQGSRYHPFAGPYQGNHDLKLTGLRPFRFIFIPQRCRGALFRLYLRHGLKASVTEDTERVRQADALHNLHDAFSITEAGGKVMSFQLAVKDNATLELKAFDLQPEQEYTIQVRDSSADDPEMLRPPSVVDGLGLPLQGSEVTLKMSQLPGLFWTPDSRNPSLWSSSVADRFLPVDAPEFFPLLARQPPLQQLGGVQPTESMQAFVCPISSTDELRDFLTFYFSPEKATSSAHGPCAAKAAAGHAGVLLAADTRHVQFNEIRLDFTASRLLFLELACMAGPDTRQCGFQSPSNMGRFLNAPSFELTVAFAGPREAPYAVGDVPNGVVLAAVHGLHDASPKHGFEVIVWEVPSTRWEDGRTLQPPVRRIASSTTDAHGHAKAVLKQEKLQHHMFSGKKGYVVSVQDPGSGEILLSDLLRLGRMPPQVQSESAQFAATLRVSLTTDRSVYAPGDALAILGVVAAVGAGCPGKKPGNICAPSAVAVHDEQTALLAAEIIWKLDRGPGQDEVCTVHLWPVSTFGMFSANISVPEDAAFGPVPSFSLFWARDAPVEVLKSCQAWRKHRLRRQDPALQSTAFDVLVADPRPPTAVLKFKRLPSFLRPGQPLEVEVLLETYTGIPLQNHKVKVEISKKTMDAQPQQLPVIEEGPQAQPSQKEVDKSTDELGIWSQALTFGPQGEVPWTPKLGDEVTLKVSARGPTGELLAKSQTLPVRLSPYHVDIRTSAGLAGTEGQLPGQDFTAWVNLKAKFSDEGWGISKGPDAAKIFLLPFPEQEEDGKPRSQGAQSTCIAWVHSQARMQALTPDRFVDERVCRHEISLEKPASCQFRMPAAAKYVLVAEVDVHGDAGMELIYGCTFVGQTTSHWRHRPVGSPNVFDRFEVRPSKPSYEIGDPLHVEVWNPLGVRSRLMILWGDQPAVLHVENVTGSQTVSLGIVTEADCPMPLCQVHVFACSTEDPSSILRTVPLSVHYPKAAPVWAHQEVKLKISRPHNALKVQVAPQISTTTPGGDVEIEVQLGQTTGQAEVALMVVDKAWLDLRPSKLHDPLEAFEPSEIEARGPQWHVVTSLDGIASGSALRKATDIVRERLTHNPWMGFLSWPLSLRRTDESELDNDDYLDQWGQDLTEFPQSELVEELDYMTRGGGHLMAKGMMVPMAFAESAPVPAGAKALLATADMAAAPEAAEESGSGPHSGAQVTLRKRFAKLVALNRALLEPGVKSWKTRVRLPQDLSTYVIRAVAVSQETGTWSWGSAESSIQTSQPVYGKPLLPRMLRFLDVCRMGVAIEAVSGEAPRPLLVEAANVQNLRLLDEEAEQAITMTSKSAEVRFSFASDISVGPAYIVFNIKDAETRAVLDSVAANIDVEVQQQGLRLASTTSIRANSSQASVRKEAIAPLNAVPGSGEMSFSASVGFQAPLLAALLELVPPSLEKWEPLGEDLLALLLGGLILHVGYGLEASHEGLSTAISAAEQRLQGQIVRGLGFVSAPPEERRWRAGKVNQVPDLLLNSLALLTVRAAQALGSVPPSWAPLDAGVLLQAALKAVQKQKEEWSRCCQGEMSLSSFIGQWQLAVFFLAHPPAQSRQDLQPLWEELLRKAITGPKGSELDILTRIASAELRRGLVPAFGADRRAYVTASALLERTRVQGPTAYIAAAEGSMHAASRWVQSLSLWLWSGLTQHAQNPVAPLVASQLLSADRSPWQRSLPPRDLIMIAVSLLAFDAASGSSKEADIPLQIVAQAETLLEVELRSAPPNKLLTVWTAWPCSELPDTLPKTGMDLEIQVGAGQGLAIVSYAMDLIPIKPFLEPQFKGIIVQKIVQKLDAHGRCRGPPVHIAQPGQLLCVTVQLTSPDDLDQVEVLDLVPAGLEPLDEALPAAAVAAGEGVQGGRKKFSWGLLLGRSWQRTVRRDSVRWRTGYVWGGTHTLTFNCMANAPGVYSLPAAKAYSAKFPEVMGFSGAASFMVEDTANSPHAVSALRLQQLRKAVGSAYQVELGSPGATPQVTLQLPVACAQVCPAAGSCNLARGICECASSSGDLLPCEDLSPQEPIHAQPGMPWQTRHQEAPPPAHPPTGSLEAPDTFDTSDSKMVVAGLVLAVVAACIYSYVARMKTPRNFVQSEMELGSEPFAAMDEEIAPSRREPLSRSEGSRQRLGGAGALAATEAAE